MRSHTSALIFAFWTGLGLLESSKAYVAEQLRGPEAAIPGVATGWEAALAAIRQLDLSRLLAPPAGPSAPPDDGR